MLNRVLDADLVDGPFRCDGDCPIGLAGKPVNRDPVIEPLKKIDDKRDILLLREQRKYARAVILLQHGIPDHVEIVQFDTVDTEPIQERRRLENLIAGFRWKTKNQVRADA